MPVNSTHPMYDQFLSQWKKCRSVVEGEDAVKADGIAHLPMLTDSTGPEYDRYRLRASFFGATKRTVIGLAGAVMRKAPEVKFPKAQEELLNTIGVKNTPLGGLMKRSVEELLTTGRLGMYVDAPEGENTNPFVALYYAENIINWQPGIVEGKEVPVMVVMAEKVEVRDSKDPFVVTMQEKWRVLRLGDITPDGGGPAVRTYTVEVWREKTPEEKRDGADDKFIMESEVTPRKWGGLVFNYIPFALVNPTGISDEVENSPVLDMANVNLSIYRNSADREHGLHFLALPTVWVAGFDLKGEKTLRVGAENAWAAEDPNATAGMLEYTGQGIGSIALAMEDKKKELAILGGRLLEEQKKEAETATTVMLRQAGESSVLSNIATSCSHAWTQVLRWVADWMGQAQEQVEVVLNQDFTVTNVDGQTLAQLSADVQSGLISWDVYFFNLKRAEMVPDNINADDERKRIEAGVPMSPPNPQREHELEKIKAAALLKNPPENGNQQEE